MRVIVTKKKFTIVNMETDKKIIVKWADAVLTQRTIKIIKMKWATH